MHKNLYPLATVIIGLCLTYWLASGISPQYTAQSQISISDEKVMSDETQLLASKDFALRVIKRLKSTETEQSTFKNQHVSGANLKTMSAESLDKELSERLNEILSGLSVNAAQKPQTIEIKATAIPPEKAASIANAYANEYIAQQQRALNIERESTRQTLQQKAQHAHATWEQYRIVNNIYENWIYG